MLRITIFGDEFFDETAEQFIYPDAVELEFEHSLVSLSKWESKFEKPFLSETSKTAEEILAYIEAMIITPNCPPGVLGKLSQANLDEIHAYIESKQTGTTFRDTGKDRGKAEPISAELIYYWMVGFNVPFECQHWHLNRLFSLLRVCSIKQSKPTKMSKSEMAASRRALNQRRLNELNTNG